MKTVGIITYHHYYNYGTVLQAYALQKAIDKLGGYNAEIIDYRSINEEELSRLQTIFMRIRRLFVYVKEYDRVSRLHRYRYILTKKNRAFDLFFEQNLPTGKIVYQSYSQLKDNPPHYDIYITGSDQTWSPKIGFRPAMFLDFAVATGIRIAYAPSIGQSVLSKEEKAYLNVNLQPYDAVSCREQRGSELLLSFVKGKDIKTVLDPTLLLDATDWDELAIPPEINKQYILCYFIGHRTYYRDIAKKLSEKLNLPLYYIPVSWRELGENCNLLPDAGPKEFLGLIRDARLVLTDSFHGTVFSINYRKTFYSFTKIAGGNSASDNSRLYDILNTLHLSGRLIDDSITDIPFSDVNYNDAEKVLAIKRKQSLKYLSDSLISRNVCTHSECTDCEACVSACAHNAITVERDLMGFRYPQKILYKCVDCGLCQIVCPNNTTPKFHKAIESCVAAAVVTDEQLSSTSGGIASVLARHIIRKGGVVYGCTSVDSKHIRHIRVDNEADIALLKGSKYVQSDMHSIMQQIKIDLVNGIWVLFIGTPCQVAGLKTFLRKPYANLYTADFVCHGVPSQQMFNDIVSKDYPLFGQQESSVGFRFKDDGTESKYGIKLIDANGTQSYKEVFPQSRYVAGFLSGMFYRESCYQCHYAKGERVSDITLGDYWDREHRYADIKQKQNGLSMVMVNTPIGQLLFDEVSEMITTRYVSTETLQKRNGQLAKPMRKHQAYERFRYIYMNDGYTASNAQMLDDEIRRVKRDMRIAATVAVIKRTAFGRFAINLVKNMYKSGNKVIISRLKRGG